MRFSALRAALVFGALLVTTAPVSAATLDLLPTYTGPQGLDLDVLSADVTYDVPSDTLTFTSLFGGAIGTTPGALYVFGLDRGAGTQRFIGGTPSIGQGITFDSALVVNASGNSFFNDIINGVITPVAPAAITVNGGNLTIQLAASLVPTAGKAIADWTFNLWPRVGVGSNAQISDFLPDASNAALTVTPIPAAAPLLAAALGLGGFAARRRARRA